MNDLFFHLPWQMCIFHLVWVGIFFRRWCTQICHCKCAFCSSFCAQMAWNLHWPLTTNNSHTFFWRGILVWYQWFAHRTRQISSIRFQQDYMFAQWLCAVVLLPPFFTSLTVHSYHIPLIYCCRLALHFRCFGPFFTSFNNDFNSTDDHNVIHKFGDYFQAINKLHKSFK